MTVDWIPPAPDWIRVDPGAYRRWQDIWVQMDQTRVGPQHADLVALYCRTYATMERAAEDIALIGATAQAVTRKADGSEVTRPVVNPACAVFSDAAKCIAELARMLGLRPDVPLVPRQHYFAEQLEPDDDDDDGADG